MVETAACTCLVDALGPLAGLAPKDVLALRLGQAIQRLHPVCRPAQGDLSDKIHRAT